MATLTGFYDAFTSKPSGWFHLVLTLNPTRDEVKIYNNGQFDDSGNTPVYPDNFSGGTNGLVIGRFYIDRDERYGKIEIDELTFWNRELTSAEVLSLYQQYS